MSQLYKKEDPGLPSLLKLRQIAQPEASCQTSACADGTYCKVLPTENHFERTKAIDGRNRQDNKAESKESIDLAFLLSLLNVELFHNRSSLRSFVFILQI